MLPDLAQALRLQALDRRITSLDSEIATLPKHIAEIEKKLESHTRRLEVDRAALTANQREHKKLEGEIQIQEQKISKLKDQMLQAKNKRAVSRLSERNLLHRGRDPQVRGQDPGHRISIS